MEIVKHKLRQSGELCREPACFIPQTHRCAMLLGMRSWTVMVSQTLMVRSAPRAC